MKYFLSLLIALLLCGPSQAQFLKKLKKKVADRTEQKIIDKSADKSAETTGKKMDDIFSVFDQKDQKENPAAEPGESGALKPKSNYHFTYLYQMAIEGGQLKDSQHLDFLLEPNADYSAMNMSTKQGNMLMIFDYTQKAGFNFMTANNSKVMMVSDLSQIWDDDSKNPFDDDLNDYKISDLPPKNFLGYEAQGKLIESDDWETQMYYTEEVPIAMQHLFKSSSQNVKDPSTSALQKQLQGLGKGVVMYLKSTDKKSNEVYTMTCTRLDKIDQNFATGDYKRMNH